MAKVISTSYVTNKINGIRVNKSYKSLAANFQNRDSRSVSYIVMHYTGNSKDVAKNNAIYFQSGSRNASAHFFVDNTSIYQSVELRDIAWHCGGYSYYHTKCRNSNSIGIEMCCTAGNYRVSDKTITNAAHLCAYLCKKLGITAANVDKYVLRHYDITHKCCPAQMVNNEKEWVEFKKKVKSLLSKEFTPYLVKVTADSLNVREGAGTGYGVVEKVKKDEVFTITGEKEGKGASKWLKLKSGKGYISADFVKIL